MIERNPSFQKLASSYLFPEVNKRVREFLARTPYAKLLSLSIGDTSEPIPPFICQGLFKSAEQMGTQEGYKGYGPEQGDKSLREKISAFFYKQSICPEEIFISDGAKCDIGRLLFLFGPSRTIATQNPTYPAFVDSSLLFGNKIVYLPCTPHNDFFPSFEQVPPFDLLYFCSPNNPTGAVASYSQLEKLIAFVQKRKAILLFDSAYSGFVNDPSIPHSIYEIPGAKETTIEISSFSKFAGFTGIRLGWTIVPKTLCYQSGHSVNTDWNRVVTTVFNGASVISQAGGLAALAEKGQEEMKALIGFYRDNTRLLHSALVAKGYKVYGGLHAPYLWVKVGNDSSWNLFQKFLEEKQIITTPGSGFGSEGEGFLRFSAFGKRETILEAVKRI